MVEGQLTGPCDYLSGAAMLPVNRRHLNATVAAQHIYNNTRLGGPYDNAFKSFCNNSGDTAAGGSWAKTGTNAVINQAVKAQHTVMPVAAMR